MTLTDPQLAAWQSFYVIIGSSGAALIGLQFVVITLIAGMNRRTDMSTVSAFGTPTVVHFTVAVLIAAVMSAPWGSSMPPAVVLALTGAVALAYVLVSLRRARKQTGYTPVWEDWVWFSLLPCALDAALGVGALLLLTAKAPALFVIAATALGLLLVGIHNAWDTVTHLVVTHTQREHAKRHPPQGVPNVEIKRSGSQPSGKGPADYFTGTVRIDPLFQPQEPARVAGASVTFEPGARTAWHVHPLGQTLIVTAGSGRAQRWGGPIEEIRPGDVIQFAPGEKHWHGASPTTAMTHTAIQEQLDGKTVEWLEQVSEAQYLA